ncbi:hypothetical protein VFPPC_17720 [Pochonia chlamydosporia 170]|uniref:Uncharacterized protein n=1 Tax=Pochonia chlamydosporia 170 TaxID=1380566 RepID=A0A219AS41_METCM|nr:hypothetical protein VFPPC_17720 [Pochonia chlamydosporia 170]OWT43104.1 hypothetical protein VFPPC_17720 [Pochonia chlamydosporia 170]
MRLRAPLSELQDMVRSYASSEAPRAKTVAHSITLEIADFERWLPSQRQSSPSAKIESFLYRRPIRHCLASRKAAFCSPRVAETEDIARTLKLRSTTLQGNHQSVWLLELQFPSW